MTDVGVTVGGDVDVRDAVSVAGLVGAPVEVGSGIVDTGASDVKEETP